MKRFTLMGVCVFALGGAACKTAAPAQIDTRPFEPGQGSCLMTVQQGERVATTRRVDHGNGFKTLTDEDGDGNPDFIATYELDREGRVAVIRTTDPGGTALQTETRTWDGARLTMREVDRFDASGRPGIDGQIDEREVLVWQQDRLVRNEHDQLDANDLLGVDGVPERVTTWTWTGGVRASGVTVDRRDDAPLQTVAMKWRDDRLMAEAIDLGSDGEVDVEIVHEWRGNQLVSTRVDGLGPQRLVRYTPCQ